MNTFDLVVYAGFAIAIITGFNTGLLRSALAILAYLIAAPIAVWVMTKVVPLLGSGSASPMMQNWGLFFGVYLVLGVVVGKMMRAALDDAIGPETGIGDRLAGAALGAVRAGMVVTAVVLVFDQLVPRDHQPPFLNGSRLRPLFSAAGQKGLSSLPSDAAATIDRLKREQQI